MALDSDQPTLLTTAIVQLSSLARASRDRVWQRQLLELAAACSAYAKAPKPAEKERIATKATSLAAAAAQLGEDASAQAAQAVIVALAAPMPGPAPAPAPRTSAASSPSAPAMTTAPLRARAGVPDLDLANPPPSTRPLRPVVAVPTTAPVPARPAAPPRPMPAPAPGPRPLDLGHGLANSKVTEPLNGLPIAAVQPLVVIVDGEPETRRLLSTYFAVAGFRVDAYDDGGRAMARVREERPVLIVMDLILPTTPGEVLILALRRSPATAHIPILVVTSEPWRLGSEHEVDGILTKPVNVTTVIEAARRLVAASAGTDSLQASRT